MEDQSHVLKTIVYWAPSTVPGTKHAPHLPLALCWTWPSLLFGNTSPLSVESFPGLLCNLLLFPTFSAPLSPSYLPLFFTPSLKNFPKRKSSCCLFPTNSTWLFFRPHALFVPYTTSSSYFPSRLRNVVVLITSVSFTWTHCSHGHHNWNCCRYFFLASIRHQNNLFYRRLPWVPSPIQEPVDVYLCYSTHPNSTRRLQTGSTNHVSLTEPLMKKKRNRTNAFWRKQN